MEEPLMHKIPQTEFEKLIWERHMNKLLLEQISRLKQEHGVLQSEIDEAKDEVNKLLKTMSSHNLGQLTLVNRKLKNLNAEKDLKIRDLKRTNDDLMTGYIRLQQEKRLPKKVLLEDDIDERAG